MTLLWCISKFSQLYELSLCNKINVQPFLVESINIAPKLGIFPEAEVNIHYQGFNIVDIPRGRVE